MSPAGQVYVPALGKYVSAYTARQYAASKAAESSRAASVSGSPGASGFVVKVGEQGYSFQGSQQEAEAFAQKTAEAQAKLAKPAGYTVQTKGGPVSVAAERVGQFIGLQALQGQLRPVENRVSYMGKREPAINPSAPKQTLQTSQVQGQRAFYASQQNEVAAREQRAYGEYGAGVSRALTSPVDVVPGRETPIGYATGAAKTFLGSVGSLVDVPVEIGKGFARGQPLGNKEGTIGFSRVGREAVEGTSSMVGEAMQGKPEAIGSLVVAAGSLGLAGRSLLKVKGEAPSELWLKADTIVGKRTSMGSNLMKIEGVTSLVSKPVLIEENLATGARTEVFASAKPSWTAVVKVEGDFGVADVSTIAKAIEKTFQGKKGEANFKIESFSISKGEAALIQKKTPGEFAQALNAKPKYSVLNVAEFRGTSQALGNEFLSIKQVSYSPESVVFPRKASAPGKLFLEEGNRFSRGFTTERVLTPSKNLFKPIESQKGFSVGLFGSRQFMNVGESSFNAIAGRMKSLGNRPGINLRVLERVAPAEQQTAAKGSLSPLLFKPPKGFAFTEFADKLGRSMVQKREAEFYKPSSIVGGGEAGFAMAELVETSFKGPKSREFMPSGFRVNERTKVKGKRGSAQIPLISEEGKMGEKIIPEGKTGWNVGDKIFDEFKEKTGFKDVPALGLRGVSPQATGERIRLTDLQRLAQIQPQPDIQIQRIGTGSITPTPDWIIDVPITENPPNRFGGSGFDFFPKSRKRKLISFSKMGKLKKTTLKPTRDWGSELIQASKRKTIGVLNPFSGKGFLKAFTFGAVFKGKKGRGK